MTGRILVVYTSQDLINTVWGLPVILDRGRRVFGVFYLCFVSFLYLDLYVLGDDALIN